MGIRNSTQTIFANTLIELTKTVPFEKITVQAICDACGARRQTFYYHFKDKYELAAWIYYSSVSEALENRKINTWEQYMLVAYKGMAENRAFFKRTLTDVSQNALINEIEKSGIEIYTDVLKAQLKLEHLDDHMMYAIRYHVIACARLTKDWLLYEPEISYKAQTYRMLRVCPKEIIEVFMANDENLKE